MLTKQDYKNNYNSHIDKYGHFKGYNFTDEEFDNLIIATLIIKNENKIIGQLEFVKKIKNLTKLGLKESKDFSDAMLYIGILKYERHEIEITDYINELKTIKQLQYMIDNDLNINQVSRRNKINKILNR